MRILLPFFLFALIVGRLDRHFFKENGSFCPSHILPKWSQLPTIPTTAPPSPLLDQPFTYIGKGLEYFVFESQDEKYVLKLFRLPKNLRRYSLHRGKTPHPKLNRRFKSVQLCAEQLPRETQLLYAHLSPTDTLPPIQLIDKLGHTWSLPLDQLPFLIQAKGTPYFSYFDKLSNPKPLIRDTIQLFKTLYAKGISDQDPIFEKNYGIHNGKPFIMDIGGLQKTTPLPPEEKYLRNMTQSLFTKLEHHKLHSYYLQQLKQ